MSIREPTKRRNLKETLTRSINALGIVAIGSAYILYLYLRYISISFSKTLPDKG